MQTLVATAAGWVLLGSPAIAEARITRIEITRVESPTFGGASFGDVGQYEKLVGRAFGEVDPHDAQSQPIADIELAPRNAHGKVEYDTGFLILRPIDPRHGNHRLFYELTNRGSILTLRTLNDAVGGSATDPGATAADAGNGFLMREGYTLLYSGWDPGAVGTFSSTYPIAVQRNGKPIVGPALEELISDALPPAVPPSKATLTYPAASVDTTRATLTVRTHYGDAQTAIPATGWSFVDDHTIQLLPAGTTFEPGRLYELAYQARDPKVVGLGYAAVRDVAVFFRHDRSDDTGRPNPLAHQIDEVIASAISQPARTLNDFVELGFNRDEHGRQAVDGILNYIAGANGVFLNYRFAQPTRTTRQHIARWTPEHRFPFANQATYDPITRQFGGRLLRCSVTDSCPKIIEANSSNEYWVKAASLLHTDTLGHDLGDAPGVRTFLFSGFPHGAATGRGNCALERNPLSSNAGLRALLIDLDDWIGHRAAPPASRIPRRGNHTLAPSLPQGGVGFPNIPGVLYTGLMTTGDVFDFGRRFDDGIMDIKTRDGVIVPPVAGSPYPVFVPTTDADGNEVAGIRFPDVAVPLATYTGYGFRATGDGGPDLCDGSGQKIPFPATRAARVATGDPRLSIEERYPTHQVYVDRVRAAAEQLRRDRLLLAEDVERIVAAAQASSVGN